MSFFFWIAVSMNARCLPRVASLRAAAGSACFVPVGFLIIVVVICRGSVASSSIKPSSDAKISGLASKSAALRSIVEPSRVIGAYTWES